MRRALRSREDRPSCPARSARTFTFWTASTATSASPSARTMPTSPTRRRPGRSPSATSSSRGGRLYPGDERTLTWAGRSRRRTSSRTGQTPATTAGTATSSAPRTAVPTSRSPASSGPLASFLADAPRPGFFVRREDDGSLTACGRWARPRPGASREAGRLGDFPRRRRRAAVRVRRSRSSGRSAPPRADARQKDTSCLSGTTIRSARSCPGSSRPAPSPG